MKGFGFLVVVVFVVGLMGTVCCGGLILDPESWNFFEGMYEGEVYLVSFPVYMDPISEWLPGSFSGIAQPLPVLGNINLVDLQFGMTLPPLFDLEDFLSSYYLLGSPILVGPDWDGGEIGEGSLVVLYTGVPEPGTMFLLGVGGLMVLRRVRRR